MHFILKKHTKNILRMRLIGQDLIPHPLFVTYAACLPTELRGMSAKPLNRPCLNKRDKNGAGSLA